MNTKTKMIKISMHLPYGYLKARKALRENDDKAANDIMKTMSKNVIKSLKREVEIINLNDDLDLDGALIISNHQENFDIFALLQIFKEKISFIAKKELFNLFMFKTYAQLSKSYALDRKDARQGVKIFKQVVKDINEGTNVVVFPEGTRSKSNLMLDFNTGLFNILKRIKKPIIPVYIDGSFDEGRKKVLVIVGKPIIADFSKYSGVELKDLVYQQICDLKREHALNSRKYNILGLGDSITFGEMYDGSYQDGYYGRFIKKLNNEVLLGSANNLSVPGATISDVIDLIENNNYAKKIKEVVEDEKLIAKLVDENNHEIKDLIKKADYLLLSVGANDILKNVISRKITKDDLYQEFELMYQKLDKLVEKISTINPDIKIIYIGQYFPYPHSKTLIRFDYINILDLYLNKLEIKHKNFNKIIVSKDVLEHKGAFLPSKRNIHLSDEGYQYLYERVLEVFAKNLRNEYGYQ